MTDPGGEGIFAAVNDLAAGLVAELAEHPENFIDPEAERPLPFVPRGNVKGRAERIWLPLSRFWLPVR